MLLKDQIAIVTGAGRGIGKGIALSLARAGAIVVLCSRTENEINNVQKQLKIEGFESFTFKCDITQSAEVDNLRKFTLKLNGKIDIVVNNAGRLLKKPLVPLSAKYYKTNLFSDMDRVSVTDQEWRDVFSVNLDSVFYCCRSIVPVMLKQRQGNIINISSTSATQAHPFYCAYNSSKAAVNMLTRVLALELADYGIRVNAISPGQYHTQMTNLFWSNTIERKKRLQNIPVHRKGNIDDIGQLALYLCSDSAKYITGQIIHIDGGLTAK